MAVTNPAFFEDESAYRVPRILAQETRRAVLASLAYIRRTTERRTSVVASERGQQQYWQSDTPPERQRAAMADLIVPTLGGPPRPAQRISGKAHDFAVCTFGKTRRNDN